jgi:hypothetical protein
MIPTLLDLLCTEKVGARDGNGTGPIMPESSLFYFILQALQPFNISTHHWLKTLESKENIHSGTGPVNSGKAHCPI